MLQNIQPEEDDVSSAEPQTITNINIEENYEYIPDMYDNDDDDDDDDEVVLRPQKHRSKKPKTPTQRQKWSRDEEKELKVLFNDNFKTLQLPGQKIIEKMMKVSISNNGEIHQEKAEQYNDKTKEKLTKVLLNF